MTLKIPDASEALLLQFMVGDVAPHANWTLRLYTNDYTPVPASVVGSFTEMTTQNYAAKTLTNTSWVVTAIDPEAQAAYAEQSFVFDGSGGNTTVYGYYLTDNTAGALLWAERFASPQVVPGTLGGTISVTPTITLRTLGE